MRFILSLLLFAGAAFGQYGSVHNAAGNGPALVPGSLAAVEYFFPSRVSGAATVSLRPAGSATAIAAQVVALDSWKITFVVPPSMPAGPAQVIYRAPGDTTKWTIAEIVPSGFALFSAAQRIPLNGPASPLLLATPAASGHAVTIWGAGLGAAGNDVGVTLGGVPQTLLYAGSAPGLPGVDQINFRIAEGTPNGCYLPLTVRYGKNTVSSFLSKSADGSPCAHPWGLSPDDLRTLDTGASISLTQLTVMSNLLAASAEHAAREETVSETTTDWDAARIANYFAAQQQPPTGCSLGLTAAPAFWVNTGIFSVGTLPNTAEVLTNGTTNIEVLNGSADVVSQDSRIAALPAPLLTAGQWMLGAARFTLPAPVQMNAGAPVILARDADQTVAWGAAGYTASDYVTLSLSTAGSGGGPVLLSCAAPASAGSIRIPQDLMSHLSPGAITLSLLLQPATGPGGTGRTLVTALSTDSRAGEIR